MRTSSASFLLLAAVLIPGAAFAQRKLAVLPTQFDESARGQVPDLFDDYLLAAVQNNIEDQVIGQDDIAAILGFDKERSLLDCTDTTCMADIGGALGVDRLVVVKVARLGQDWVVTAKLINIREARVESRVNEFVGGSVKALLQSVNLLTRRLFGLAPVPPQRPVATPPPSRPPPQRTSPPVERYPSGIYFQGRTP